MDPAFKFQYLARENEAQSQDAYDGTFQVLPLRSRPHKVELGIEMLGLVDGQFLEDMSRYLSSGCSPSILSEMV